MKLLLPLVSHENASKFQQMIWFKTGTIYQLSKEHQTKSSLQTMPFFVKPEKRKICMVLKLEYDWQESTSLIGPRTPPESSFILWCLVCFKIPICMRLVCICLLLWCFMAQQGCIFLFIQWYLSRNSFGILTIFRIVLDWSSNLSYYWTKKWRQKNLSDT